jgi:carbon monoxide dehydrogenase subunit G
MIKLSETMHIAAPVADVWPFLADPVQVVGCVPGMTLTADKGDGVYEGTISVKFGPTVASFRGQARLSYDHAAKTCDIQAGGVDQKGATRATASAHIAATGQEVTAVTIDGGFNVTGPLAQFARTGGVFVARALLADFVANLSRRLEAQRAQQDGFAPEATAAAPTTVQISGLRLLSQVFLGWLKHLFRLK